MQRKNYSDYVAGFGDLKQLPRAKLLAELDGVWDKEGLNNRRSLSAQTEAVTAFYSHPVWILNGLFSEYDSDSHLHRRAIARCIKELQAEKVADYGGGSGVLAKFVVEELPMADVHIIEPYASAIFVDRLKDLSSVNFVKQLNNKYDIVVAQDVLEHVDEPVNLAVELILATRMGGHLIFANCFYPVIKCHLPATFYLRHTFVLLMKHAGLELVGKVPGAEHALLFKRIADVNYHALSTADRKAKLYGPILNWVHAISNTAKRWVKALL